MGPGFRRDDELGVETSSKAEAALFRGHDFYLRRQIGPAIAAYEEALRLGLDPEQGVQERWMAYMLAGDFERAWRESDRVLARRNELGHSCADQPFHLRWVWDGLDLTGKSVLVRCYHGLGDTIQFIRYVPLLKRVTRRVVVQAPEAVVPLLRSVPGIDGFAALSYDEPDLSFEADVELMELPHYFRTTLVTVPAHVPYLSAPASAPSVAGGFKVGLVWAAGEWRPERSVPLALFDGLAAIEGLAIYNLQRGPALVEVERSALGARMANPEGAPEDIVQTAALIEKLDLVISVDTMVAHLAGALGKRVWTLLHFHSDWRWLVDRDDSPWYPTMRLFRQGRPGGWDEPVARALKELAALRGCPASREC
jgi:hypothetical protein